MDNDKLVLVLGGSGLDVVARLTGSLQPGASNPASIRTSYGGVARNVAENLARLGQRVCLVTVAGEDPNGNDMLAYTAAAGVDVSCCLRAADLPTGYYMALLNSQARVEIAVDDMRIMRHLTPEYLDAQSHLFKQATMVFLDANLPDETIARAVRMCEAADIPLCADPASSTLSIRLLPYLPRLHLVTPNSTEAGILTGQSFDPKDQRAALRAARHLVNLGVDVALVTMAEFGVCYASSETNGHIPAIRTLIHDPTGAGDALTAAVLFALLNDIGLDDAVRLGVSAASLTLRHPGTVCTELTLERLYDELLI